MNVLYSEGHVTILQKDSKFAVRLKPTWDETFQSHKEVIKLCGFSWDNHNSVWVGSKAQMKYLANQFIQEFGYKFPDNILSQFLPDKETVFKRRKIIPDLLKSEPLGEFQTRGIELGIQQNRLLLAWEMGLGKTFTVVSILNHLIFHEEIDRILIVAPSESVYNFKRELLRFNTFDLTEEDITIANAKNRNPWESDPKVIIMTYRTFLMLSDDFYFKVKGKKSKKYTSACMPFDTWGEKGIAFISDESHMLKNPKSRTSKVVNLHKHYFSHRYLLSGTPYPNGVHELYNQLNLLDESIVGEPFNLWITRVANIGNSYSTEAINFFYPDKVEKFIESTKPWVDRQFTKGNIEIPDNVCSEIFVEMNPKQREIYESLITHTLIRLKEEEGRIVPKHVAMKFPFIMQAIEDPCLLEGKIDPVSNPGLANSIKKWKFKDHSKLEAFSSLLERYVEEEGRKVIIWDGHPGSMNRLAEHFKKYNPVVIHGEMEIPKDVPQDEYRHQVLEEFKKSKDRNVLIASYYVLSSAVNIVEATRALYWTRSWDLKHFLQSRKRNNRSGQTVETVYHPFICDKTLEVRLNFALNKKENINNNLYNKSSMTQREWKDLFLGDVSL